MNRPQAIAAKLSFQMDFRMTFLLAFGSWVAGMSRPPGDAHCTVVLVERMTALMNSREPLTYSDLVPLLGALTGLP